MKYRVFLAIWVFLSAVAMFLVNAHSQELSPEMQKIYRKCEKKLNKEFSETPKEVIQADICERVVRMPDCIITEDDIDQYIYIRFIECVTEEMGSGGDDGA